ncbi:putative conserved membrane protein [Synechococcus sp. BMK-MC-1]|nr:putative conserved membrane protein [Synechococcus sp. BMK-MC-1]
MELFIGLAMLLPLSALAIQAREAESDNDHCDFL